MTRAEGEPLATLDQGGIEAVLPPAGAGPAGVGAAARELWTTMRTPAGLAALAVLLVCVPVQFNLAGSMFGLGDILSGLLVVVLVIIAVRDGLRLSRTTAALIASVVLASSIVAVAGGEAASSFSGWVRYLQLFALVPLAVVLAIRNRREAALVAHALILAAVVEAVVCIIQFVTGTGATYQGQNNRGFGTFVSGDVIAASVVIGVGLTMCAGLTVSATGRVRVAYLVTIGVLFAGLLATLSRGSLLTTAIALVVVLSYAGWKVFVGIVVCGAAALVVVLGTVGGDQNGIIAARILSIGEQDSSTNDRAALRVAAIDMWADYPVVGVGLKEFPRYRDKYAPFDLSSGSTVGQEGSGGAGIQQQELLSPHNQYLLVLSEQGIVGFLPFALLLFVATGTAARAAWRESAATRGLGVGLVGISVWQLAQFIPGDVGGATSLITSVIIGLPLWYGLEQQQTDGSAAAPARSAS